MYQILPEPKKIVEQFGSFLADFGMKIVSVSEELMPQNGWALPGILRDYLRTWAGVRAELGSGRAYRGDISLRLDESLPKRHYRLNIMPETIEIAGGSREAVGYGISTLCQLIKVEGGYIPCLLIEDYPDVETRGYYLDQARGRSLKLAVLKRFVDDLSLFKVNQFQLYIEQSFLFRGLSEVWREDSVLTASEIVELDRYCKERDIDFVPSLASFGHLYGLLRTKSYGEFCEKEDAIGKPFSLIGKMQHHTIAVSHEKAFDLIKELFDQFFPLFSSIHINICADETFDLGREKSKELAKELGYEDLYLSFLKKLCAYVTERGKIPQFWGDVIVRKPELIKELPPETICLAWGYSPEEKESVCESLFKAGANVYLCPGVAAWNQFIADFESAYLNQKIMSQYAKKYGAKGYLNTDWGDFGHINDLAFSIPGMIYGASFSWNTDGSMSEEEMNEKISKLYYTDRSKKLMNELKKASKEVVFSWYHVVAFFEKFAEVGRFDKEREPLESLVQNRLLENIQAFRNFSDRIDTANENLEVIRISLRRIFQEMDSIHRDKLDIFNNSIWAISLWNRVGKALFIEGSYDEAGKKKLAGELEYWFMMYKELFRKEAKEGLLHRVARIIYWYGDVLRGLKDSEWEFDKKTKE